MYLSEPIVSLHYESGAEYVLSFEDGTDKIRLFEEDMDEDREYQCFTTFDAIEKNSYLSVNEIVEKTNKILVSRRIENKNCLETTVEYPSSDYPPNN